MSIRGANPNQVQVLVDGVRVKSPTLGPADLADIAPESIERIEIIRGPQSTIYGADAIGGVVQIITKKGSGPATGYSSQEVGNYDTYRAKAGVSGAWKAFDYSLGYYHLESNGLTINDGMNQNAVAGRFGLDLPWGNTRIGGAVRYNKTDTGLPIEFVGNPAPIVPTIDPNTHQETETYTASVNLRTRPVSWWEGEIRGSRYWQKQSFIDPPDPFTCPPATFGPPCDFPGTFKTQPERGGSVEPLPPGQVEHLHLRHRVAGGARQRAGHQWFLAATAGPGRASSSSSSGSSTGCSWPPACEWRTTTTSVCRPPSGARSPTW